MKHILKLALVPLFLFAFQVQGAFKPTTSKTLSLDTKTSSLTWSGEKISIGDGSHQGTVNLKSGDLTIVDGKITGGTFVIDMTSIKNTDLSKDSAKAKLVGHLQSDDFFAVKKYPTATFIISSVKHLKGKKKEISGVLKIRDVAKPETFIATVSEKGKVFEASGDITFDRRKYGANFHSESDFIKKVIAISKDKVIKDQVKIGLKLKTRPSA